MNDDNKRKTDIWCKFKHALGKFTHENDIRETDKPNKANKQNKIWRQGNKPNRSLTFWGWNEKNEPSYLILYGTHEFETEKSFDVEGSDVERFENTLKDDVTYTSYAVFSGREGHLPSFEAVNIVEDGGWQYRDREDEFPKMYYKKDSRSNGWSRDLNDDGIVNEYKKLDAGCGITIPYFEEFTYGELVSKVKNSNVHIDNFNFADNPNEILKLSEDCKEYFELLCVMMGDKNLYMRKKMLAHLLDSCTDSEVYKCIFTVGSNELLSGLFLESAKRNIDSFVSEAEHIVNDDIHYAEESYVKGLKRCAGIYLNSCDAARKAEREKWIHDNVEEIDLPLIKIDDKEIPEGKELNGLRYRKLSLQEKLVEYNVRYERNEQNRWETVKTRYVDRYKRGPFNDGVVFDIRAFKNVLQEAEAYGMADVIGKIAYYLDAPRVHYYFQGNRLGKELRYFKKYIHRIIKYYGQNNPEKFMEVMKSLFTSYTEDDFLCKFKGNFQFNYFIKNILYADFNEKAPRGWDYWRERSEWMSNDQLLKLEGRYELDKEIWDKHLEDVLYIALNANIATVLKSCYYILKESDKLNDLIEKMSYEELIKMTMASYEPLAEMFKEVLENRLGKEQKFDFNIMAALMNNENEDLVEIAMDYYKRCNGHIMPGNIVELMFFDNLEKWTEYINSCINDIKQEDYFDFVKAMIETDDRFKEKKVVLPKEITDTLSESVNKISGIKASQKSKILIYVLKEALKKASMAGFMETYLEEVVFALSYDEIKNALDKPQKSEELGNEVMEAIQEDQANEVNGENQENKENNKDQDKDENPKNIDRPENAEISENAEIADLQESLKNHTNKLSSRINRIVNIVSSILNDEIPADSVIIDVLETGTSKAVKTLFEIINSNEKQLRSRYSTMLIFFESDVVLLNEKAKEIFEKMDDDTKKSMHKVIIDSPVEKVYQFGLEKLKEIYGEFVPADFIMQMLEHTAPQVKAYISDKTENILKTLGEGDGDLFLYYAKTLLLLPNRVRKNKDDIYDALFDFAIKYQERRDEVEGLLLGMGGSNIIKDSEKALVTLAKIRKEEAV